MIQDCRWITKTPISSSSTPMLIAALRQNPHPNVTLIDVLTEIDNLGFGLETPGDPFVAISTLRRAMLSQALPKLQLLPVLSAPCGKAQCGQMQGDLEYEKDPFSGRLAPQNLICAQCGQGGVFKAEFLPEEFYVSIRGLRFGDLDEQRLPTFPNYRLAGLVQYCPITKHFRSLRAYGEFALLMDGLTTTILHGYGEIDSAIE